jgi:hypothetical protein
MNQTRTGAVSQSLPDERPLRKRPAKLSAATNADRQKLFRERHPTVRKLRSLTVEETAARSKVIRGEPHATFMGMNLWNWGNTMPRSIVEIFGMGPAVDHYLRKGKRKTGVP